jgi:hypothetical protein
VHLLVLFIVVLIQREDHTAIKQAQKTCTDSAYDAATMLWKVFMIGMINSFT